MKFKIIPKCQRAKNRVNEHGEVMKMVREENGKALFESLNETFRLNADHMILWGGWFTTEEASWELVEADEPTE